MITITLGGGALIRISKTSHSSLEEIIGLTRKTHNTLETMSANTKALLLAVTALATAITEANERTNRKLDDLKSQVANGADSADIQQAIDTIQQEIAAANKIAADTATDLQNEHGDSSATDTGTASTDAPSTDAPSTDGSTDPGEADPA